MIKAVIIFLQTIHFFLSCIYGIAIGEGCGAGPSQLYFHIYAREASVTYHLSKEAG